MKKPLVLFWMCLLVLSAQATAYPQQVNPAMHTPWYSYNINHAPEPVRLHPTYYDRNNYLYVYTHQPIRKSYTPPQPVQHNPWAGYVTQYYHPFYSNDYSRWDNY